MKNNNSSNQGAKKGYSTMIGLFIHAFFMMCLLSILAWFILVIWFCVYAFLLNGSYACSEINSILNNNEFIGYHATFFNKIIVIQQHVVSVIKQSLKYSSTYIARLLKIIHVDITPQQKIDTLISILFGAAEIVINRVMIFVMNLPLLLNIMMILIVDGLGQRDIRKFQGARESTFFFHRLKPMIKWIFVISFLMYLCAPCIIHQKVILIPMIVVISIMTRTLIQNYKKYA